MIRLIAAVDNKNGLARDGLMPWDIPADLKRFRKLTKTHGANVLMGKKTYQPIGHALVGRTTYVLTRHPKANPPKNVIIVSDLDKFIAEFDQDLWVMGGAQLFALTLSQADEIYLTIIDHDFNCDIFFPDYKKRFEVVSSEEPIVQNGLSFTYQLLRPKKR